MLQKNYIAHLKGFKLTEWCKNVYSADAFKTTLILFR